MRKAMTSHWLMNDRTMAEPHQHWLCGISALPRSPPSPANGAREIRRDLLTRNRIRVQPRFFGGLMTPRLLYKALCRGSQARRSRKERMCEPQACPRIRHRKTLSPSGHGSPRSRVWAAGLWGSLARKSGFQLRLDRHGDAHPGGTLRGDVMVPRATRTPFPAEGRALLSGGGGGSHFPGAMGQQPGRWRTERLQSRRPLLQLPSSVPDASLVLCQAAGCDVHTRTPWLSPLLHTHTRAVPHALSTPALGLQRHGQVPVAFRVRAPKVLLHRRGSTLRSRPGPLRRQPRASWGEAHLIPES